MADSAAVVWLYLIAVNVTAIFRPTHSMQPGACQACSRKLIKRQRIPHYAVDRIVAEVDLPTHQTDTSYERFTTRNSDDILQIIDEHTRSHGYVNAFTRFARSSLHRQYTIIICPLNRCFVLCFSILLVRPQTMLSSIQS